VVIGRSWMLAGSDGQTPRLHEAGDVVCKEIADMIRQGKAIFPLLVEGARLPEAAELPKELHALLRFQATTIDNARLGSDDAVADPRDRSGHSSSAERWRQAGESYERVKRAVLKTPKTLHPPHPPLGARAPVRPSTAGKRSSSHQSTSAIPTTAYSVPPLWGWPEALHEACAPARPVQRSIPDEPLGNPETRTKTLWRQPVFNTLKNTLA
jgi:hypothetical protein